MARKKEVRGGARRGKSQAHSEGRWVSRRRGRAGKESLPSRNERKHKRVSVRKNSLGGSGESWFHSKSGQN